MRWLKLSFFILLIIIVLLSFLTVYALSPKEGVDKVQEVQIISGQSVQEIAQKLEESGVIKNAFAFYLYIKLSNKKVLPGIYDLNAGSSATSIAKILNSGRFKTEKITIPEGWRVSQIHDYLQKRPSLRQISDFESVALPYEGYLFPETYFIKLDITSAELVELMRRTFKNKTEKLKLNNELVILASIIEREAKTDRDRPLIAGVYVNRLKNRMKLEADPTVQYAKNRLWTTVTVSDYRSIISPYNTYLVTGLPPTPIANPGIKSIKAAINPESHDYFYFFHAKGETYYSKTYEEHVAKIRRYLISP